MKAFVSPLAARLRAAISAAKRGLARGARLRTESAAAASLGASAAFIPLLVLSSLLVLGCRSVVQPSAPTWLVPWQVIADEHHPAITVQRLLTTQEMAAWLTAYGAEQRKVDEADAERRKADAEHAKLLEEVKAQLQREQVMMSMTTTGPIPLQVEIVHHDKPVVKRPVVVNPRMSSTSVSTTKP